MKTGIKNKGFMENRVNWRTVYEVSSFALVIIICAFAGAHTALMTQQEGIQVLTNIGLHPFLTVFSSCVTVWLVQTNPLISFLATSSTVLNALLI
jgi:predicted nicotinamide N-methyase